jgi:hypothetical protein
MSRRIVFENDMIVIVDVSDELPRHRNYPHGSDARKPDGQRAINPNFRYYDRPGRKIKRVIYHHTGGGYTPNIRGLKNTAHFFTRDPVYTTIAGNRPQDPRKIRWTGNGRGWPAFGYHLFVPWEPERDQGRAVVYQCNPLDRVSWHTGSGQNKHGLGVVFQGWFYSSAAPRHKLGRGLVRKPSLAQMTAAYHVFCSYLQPLYDLPNSALATHAEHGKPACPGDELSAFVRDVRRCGTNYEWHQFSELVF